MAIAPTSIKVMVLPQDNPDPEEKPDFRYETLQTIRTDIRPPNAAPDKLAGLLSDAEGCAAEHHLLYYLNESTPQPNVSLLPDFGKAYWGTEAWKQRGALGTAKYHIFFTLSNSTALAQNRNMEYKVRGDAFIVELSDTEDENGRRFYVDLEPVDLGPERLLELVSLVADYPKMLSLKHLSGPSDVEDNYWEDQETGVDAPRCFHCGTIQQETVLTVE